MPTDEINTSASLPDAIYESSENTFTIIPNNEVTQSNFVEIDFPKSRTIKFSNEKGVVRFSVNYEKIEGQLKTFRANTSTL